MNKKLLTFIISILFLTAHNTSFAAQPKKKKKYEKKQRYIQKSVCLNCYKRFGNQKSIDNKISFCKVCAEQKYQCSNCPKSCSLNNSSRLFIYNKAHVVEKFFMFCNTCKYQCNRCKKTFKVDKIAEHSPSIKQQNSFQHLCEECCKEIYEDFWRKDCWRCEQPLDKIEDQQVNLHFCRKCLREVVQCRNCKKNRLLKDMLLDDYQDEHTPGATSIFVFCSLCKYRCVDCKKLFKYNDIAQQEESETLGGKSINNHVCTNCVCIRKLKSKKIFM